MTAPGGAAAAEVFQVIFAPDDIRELSLEQLDDCFRLGLVDEETWVWTEGMEDWETLGEAAGLGAGEPEPDSTVRPRPGAQLGTPPPLPGELPPPLPFAPGGGPSYQAQGAYQQIASAPAAIHHGAPAWGAPQDSTWPSAPAVDRAAVSEWPAGGPYSAPPYSAPAGSPYSAPPYSAPAGDPYSVPVAGPYSGPAEGPYSAPPYSAPAAYPQAGSSYPPVAPASGPFPGVINTLSAPSAANFAPQTAPPLVFDTQDDNPFQARPGRLRGRLQSTLLLAALLVGGVVTAYRNDWLLVAAQRADLEATYLRLEQQWFGGAPAGTPRQLQALVGGAEAKKSALFGASALTDSSKSAAAQPSAVTRNQAADQAVERASEDAPSVKDARQQAEQAPVARATDGEGAASDAPRDQREEAIKPSPVGAAERSPSAASPPPQQPAARSQAVASKRRAPARAVSKPASAPTKPAKPAPVTKTASASSKPAPAPGTDDFLRMSMRQAVKSGGSSGSKAQKKPSASAYDPLNGDI